MSHRITQPQRVFGGTDLSAMLPNMLLTLSVFLFGEIGRIMGRVWQVIYLFMYCQASTLLRMPWDPRKCIPPADCAIIRMGTGIRRISCWACWIIQTKMI